MAISPSSGRDKDLVITRWFNAYPKEIETEIDVIEGVIESAVIGVPHPDLSGNVTTIVVKKPACDLSNRDVIGLFDGRLAKFKLPKRIFFVGDLPRNAMGKVLKNALRQRYGGIYDGQGSRQQA